MVLVEPVVSRDVGVCREEKTASATSRIRDDLARHRAHAVDQRVDQRPRREVLPRAALRVLGVPLQQALVSFAFDVRRHLQPRLIANQVDDKLAELGGVLNLVLGLAEDEPQHPALLAELPQRVAVVLLQLDAFHLRVGEVDPPKASGDGLRLAREGGPLPAGWRPLEFKKIPRHTVYALVRDGDAVVVEAKSESAASGLVRPIAQALKKPIPNGGAKRPIPIARITTIA